MIFVWVTRGRTWGFRVLRTGGLADAFEAYESAFAELEEAATASRLVQGRLAVRFPDPEGRRDKAGRVISHEFLLLPPLDDAVSSVDAVRELVWPQVENTYRDSWDVATAPTPTE